jgi:FkbM family methyltransferase
MINIDPLVRIEMTCSCHDCDPIPRVADAGTVATFRNRSVQVMHNGVRVLAGAYQGDWRVEVIRRLRGCHEPQEEVVFWETMKRLPASPTMIELGAFWAYYSCWFLKDRPAGRVFCVEPDPGNLSIGQTNLQLNDQQATFIQATVAATPLGPKPFFCESDGAIRKVPAVSVDGLVHDYGIPHIDVLLSNIQGAETAMLEGCRETIRAGKLRFLFVSTHHHSISHDPLTHQKCLAFIREQGGHILAEYTVTESFSGDGLIAASFAMEDRGLAQIPLSRNRASTNMWREPEYDLAEALHRGTGSASVYDRLIQAEAEKHSLVREVQRLSDAVEERQMRLLTSEPELALLKTQREQYQHGMAELNAARAKMAWYEAERGTFGAQIGRWLTRQRNRFAPADSARGKWVSLAVKSARTLHSEGLRALVKKSAHYMTRRKSRMK